MKAAPLTAPTVFVMTSGEQLETHEYVLTSKSVSVTGGTAAVIPDSDVDLKATVAANQERGVDLKIPGRHEIFLGRY